MRGRLPALANGVPPPSAHVIVHVGMKCFMGGQCTHGGPPRVPRPLPGAHMVLRVGVVVVHVDERAGAGAGLLRVVVRLRAHGPVRVIDRIDLLVRREDLRARARASGRGRGQRVCECSGLQHAPTTILAGSVRAGTLACNLIRTSRACKVCFAGTQGLLCRRGRWNPRPGARHVAWARGHALKL